MAGPGTGADFKIFEPQYYAGQYEVLSRVVGAFNAASGGAITLVNQSVIGNYEKESFLKDVANIIGRRNLASVGTVEDLLMTMDEWVNVKLNRRIGPIAQTLDAWRKIGSNAQEMSFVLGKQVAMKKMADYADAALMAAVAAISGVTTGGPKAIGLNYDATGQTTKTLTPAHLVQGLSLMGDRAAQVVAWAMHSKPFFDLVGNALSEKIYGEANVVVYGGAPGTLGRPVLVIDSPPLHNDGGSLTDTYNVLGLVAGGVMIKESEREEIYSRVVDGHEQLFFRVQGEYAFNVGVKGFRWNTVGGGVNPTDAAVATATNWVSAMLDPKDLAGVRILVQ